MVRVLSGDLAAWRARRIAEATLAHPDDVATHVDEHVWAVAHKVGLVTLAKLLDEAKLALYPREREQERLDALDRRQVRMLRDISANGVATMVIEADLKDVLDFEGTVSRLAAVLKDAGCTESRDVRRALAVGILADPARAVALLEGEPEPGTGAGAASRRRGKQMTLVVHLSAAAVTGACRACGAVDFSGAVGRFERGDRPVSAAMVRDWCGREDTALTVLPVVDDREHVAVDRYEIPDRLKDLVDRRSPSCVFPWCTRAARGCDHDHAVAHGQGGRTCSCNIGPLCRRHHRLKTHRGWDCEVLEPGAYLWRSPFGRTYFRDAHGTVDVTLPGETSDHQGCFDPDQLSTDAFAPDPVRRRERLARMSARMARVRDARGYSHTDPDFQPTDIVAWQMTDEDDPVTATRPPGHPVPPGELEWQLRHPPPPPPDDTPPF